MKLIEAVEKVLEEDPRTRKNEYLWLYMIKVLRVMGFKISIGFDRSMPSPESIIKERRDVLNKKNTYARDFIPEPGVTYEKKIQDAIRK